MDAGVNPLIVPLALPGASKRSEMYTCAVEKPARAALLLTQSNHLNGRRIVSEEVMTCSQADAAGSNVHSYEHEIKSGKLNDAKPERICHRNVALDSPPGFLLGIDPHQSVTGRLA